MGDGARGAYYNEFDPAVAAWLRELIRRDLIAPGDVDERSIEDVRPDDLRGYAQHHFFAGIGGWSYALRLAGWPDDQPVWTGSCPCQPFSSAGKGAGFDDQRHLWPAFFHLIRQCRPAVVFGEQVASKAADAWIDLVHADLEGMGYAFGCVPFPSAGIGAPHIRDRNYWLAHANVSRLEGRRGMRERAAECAARPGGVDGRLADSGHRARGITGELPSAARADEGAAPDEGRHGLDGTAAHRSADRRMGDADRAGSQPRGSGPEADRYGRSAVADGGAFGVADADCRERDGLAVVRGIERYGQDAGWTEGRGGAAARSVAHGASPLHGFWRDADWLLCRDGKWRPVEPGSFPLAHGIPARVVRLRGYGNAINPHQAAEFIRASVATRVEASRAA